LDDFSKRLRLNRDDIIALCPAGVFDAIVNGIPRSLQARTLLGSNNGQIKQKQDELFTAEVSFPFTTNQGLLIAPQTKKVKKTDNDLWEEYRAWAFCVIYTLLRYGKMK
jgi:DNA polymerase-3 subunit alpha/error-prone DNA polymerase